MTIALQAPWVTSSDGVLDAAGVQQNFDQFAAMFPLGAGTATFRQFPQARAYRNTNTAALGTGAWAAIDFDLEAYDGGTPQSNMHDNATNPSRLTVRVPGTYVVSACFEWANAAGAIRAARLILNQAVVLDVDSKAPVGGGNFTAHSLDSNYRFVIGDYVQVEGFQDSGAGLVVLGAGNLNPYLAMTWVGS